MSKKLPTFQKGSTLVIRVGDTELAYCQNISFSEDMMLQPVGGIGSFSMHAIEPTGYIARGSMTITHYSSKILNELSADQIPGDITKNDAKDGNSLLQGAYFNPVMLLASTDFDIHVYERNFGSEVLGKSKAVNINSAASWTITGCRLASYNIGWAPGSLVNESVSFLCRAIEDSKV